jgi:hypothetical protein
MIRAAAALTWDGARFPARRLPVKARSFLGAVTPAARIKTLLQANDALEVRICWVPRLVGGPATLCAPFATENSRRISFRLVRTVAFGDVLGAVYRRLPRPTQVSFQL